MPLLFAGAQTGSKWGCGIPHTGGLVTFVSGLLTRVGRVRVTTIATQSSCACTFLPELDGIASVGFHASAIWPLALPRRGRQSPASWATLQTATSFGWNGTSTALELSGGLRPAVTATTLTLCQVY